jgi:hypothetical protein
VMMEISDRVRKQAGIGEGDDEAEAEEFTDADDAPINIET